MVCSVVGVDDIDGEPLDHNHNEGQFFSIKTAYESDDIDGAPLGDYLSRRLISRDCHLHSLTNGLLYR
jgi:hypothetical protein